MEKIPLDALPLLDLEGRPRSLKECAGDLILVIFLRHLA